ncbi:MAG: septum formation initiator family protein [Oscillospiraceae bacterium]
MKLKRASIFTKLVILTVALYAVISLVTVRAQVAEAEKLRQELSTQVAEMAQKNAALEYQLDHGADDEMIEEIARDKLGLVMPGEKIFYDISD